MWLKSFRKESTAREKNRKLHSTIGHNWYQRAGIFFSPICKLIKRKFIVRFSPLLKGEIISEKKLLAGNKTNKIPLIEILICIVSMKVTNYYAWEFEAKNRLKIAFNNKEKIEVFHVHEFEPHYFAIVFRNLKVCISRTGFFILFGALLFLNVSVCIWRTSR